jgi:hypothetical protein
MDTRVYYSRRRVAATQDPVFDTRVPVRDTRDPVFKNSRSRLLFSAVNQNYSRSKLRDSHASNRTSTASIQLTSFRWLEWPQGLEWSVWRLRSGWFG